MQSLQKTRMTNKDGKKVRKNIQLRFIDSCRFMASSLDELARNLCDTRRFQCDKCKGDMELVNISNKYIALLECKRCKTRNSKDLDESVLKKNFDHTSRYWDCYQKFRLMIWKGVYPYECMDSSKKFEEKNLPPKTKFYNKLDMKCMSDNDYEDAQQVWNNTEKKSLGCYHDTYLKIDVLLVENVFETFRNTCLEH